MWPSSTSRNAGPGTTATDERAVDGTRHPRGQAHQEATALLKTVRPDGAALARDLGTVLGVKDAAHYGTVFVSSTVLRSTLRAAARLVAAAEAALQTSG